MSDDYMTRAEALDVLNVKPGTLYAYASRGKIKTQSHPDGRRSLYLRADVERLSSRKRGRPQKTTTTAADASMLWGEPVISSGITRIHDTGPIYRKRSSAEMARAGVSFETVAHLLFTGMWKEEIDAWPPIETPPDTTELLTSRPQSPGSGDIPNLLGIATWSLGMRNRGVSEISEGTTVRHARLLMQTMAGCLGYLSPKSEFVYRDPNESLAALAIRASSTQTRISTEAERALNGALIMLADHELAPATFAVRVAASTNTDIFNCIATAIGSHAGFSTGIATQNVEKLLFQSTNPNALTQRLSMVEKYGSRRFGFNHPMYPKGDPRADVILEFVENLSAPGEGTHNILDFLNQTRHKLGARPGIAIALVTLTRALSMPDGSATGLLILSRTAGWIAHILEQRAQATLLRPRARFIDTEPVTRPL